MGVVLLWSLAALILVVARWIDPPTTAVHIQRRVQAWIHHTPYHERYKFILLSQISPDLQRAVIAAEDARFYQHHGFDWYEIQIAAEDDLEGGRTRGTSTLTQQLVKTYSSEQAALSSARARSSHWYRWPNWSSASGAFWRSTSTSSNGALVSMAQTRRVTTSTKPRPGGVDRVQSVQLAAILPLPLKRRPERMTHYSAIILERMRQMGW